LTNDSKKYIIESGFAPHRRNGYKMKKIKLGKSEIIVPNIGVGCMRIANLETEDIEKFIYTALSVGLNFFDHADIYGGGESERKFSEAIKMTPSLREKLIIQSKCGIVSGKMYDFSKEHIISSVNGSLKRLNTDYLDVLLLHRPDMLVEPEEVAEAFIQLKSEGKVKYFGVSNHKPLQIELLKKYLPFPIIVNQMQLSIAHAGMITTGINANIDGCGEDRDGGILDYCRINDITVQAWSPFQYGFFGGIFIGNEKFKELNVKLNELSEKYDVTPSAIALSWILRHPAQIQPIVGTTKPERLTELSKASEIYLTREEWYSLLLSAGNRLP